MSPLKNTLLAALAAAVLTAGALYYVQHNRVQEAGRLRHENNQMRFQANQRRHVEKPAAVSSAGANEEPRDSAPIAGTSPAPNPANDYRNEGQATPLATLQTFAWACDRGDAAAVEKLLRFEDAAREKARALMSSLPEHIGGPWTSPEAMAAALLTANAIEHPFPSATILERATLSPIDDTRVLLLLPGAGPLRERTAYQKTGDIWQYVITEAMVDDYVRRNAE